ncbi:hypothetical protein [Luteimonas huabeiensis]|uniref:hypothetical protein n=1 Tax=Luteimonas huabeiensis TaxID=1244513 RepID=UPI000466BD81|nr:hypothetical protein [Luteimonas huabeiensis]
MGLRAFRTIRQSRMFRGASLLLGAVAALLSGGCDKVARQTLYDRDGLVATRIERRYHDWSTGTDRTAVGYKIRFRGEALCGERLTRLLYADAPERAPYVPRHCPVAAEAAGRAGLLAFLDVSSIGDPRLARLYVDRGELVVERLLDERPERLHSGRFLPPRIDGWSRIATPAGDTLMIAHDPLRIVDLGRGELLDIEDGTALLIDRWRPPAGVAATFHAVRLADGTRLASLEMPAPCLALPDLQLDEPRARLPAAQGRARIDFDEVPAWRRTVLSWRPDAAELTPAMPCDRAGRAAAG